MATLKIKSSHESQGDFVIIDENDFDENIHLLFEEPVKEPVEMIKKSWPETKSKSKTK
jgi:hypothetical protein